MILHRDEKIASLDVAECTIAQAVERGHAIACLESDCMTGCDKGLFVTQVKELVDCVSLQFTNDGIPTFVSCGGHFKLKTNHGYKMIDDIGKNDLVVDVYGRLSRLRKKTLVPGNGEVWYEVCSKSSMVIVVNDKYFML